MTDKPPRDPSAASAPGARVEGTGDGGKERDGAPSGESSGEPSGEIDEAILARVSDYLDGTLTGSDHAEVAAKIAQEETWQRAHVELTETRNYLSGMRKAHAPSSFTEHVAETIHRRSAGRFFGRRTLGDRVPFGALLAVALLGLAVLAYVLWSSSTGSLKVDRSRDHAPEGSSAIAPP